MSPNASNQFNSSMNRDKSNIDANSFSSPSKFKAGDFIQNKSSMEQYLQEVSQHEKELASAIEAQHNMSGYVGNNFNTFWGNYRFDEIIALLKTQIYSLSPHQNKQNPLDENYMRKDQENNSEIIRKMCANKLSNYTANLKMVNSFEDNRKKRICFEILMVSRIHSGYQRPFWSPLFRPSKRSTKRFSSADSPT